MLWASGSIITQFVANDVGYNQPFVFTFFGSGVISFLVPSYLGLSLLGLAQNPPLRERSGESHRLRIHRWNRSHTLVVVSKIHLYLCVGPAPPLELDSTFVRVGVEQQYFNQYRLRLEHETAEATAQATAQATE